MGNVRWSVQPGTAVASSNTKAMHKVHSMRPTRTSRIYPNSSRVGTLDLAQPSRPSANASRSERYE